MTKLMLIDGNSLANRAFYAIPPLTNPDGLATNAIFGFLNMLQKIRKEEKPAYIAVAFDAGRKVFRHEMYAGYKGSRKGMPEELRAQMPILREVLDAIGIPWLEAEGYEADDLIGTLAAMGSGAGFNVRIITGDRDCFQLIDARTDVLFTRKGISELECFDETHLMEIYGLQPWQIVELKGLMGDSSDDIPGIPGVGEKTALKLLADHESVEGVLAAAGAYAGKKLGEKLVEYRDLARLSRQLAEIHRDVPVTVALEELKPRAGDREERIRLYRMLAFKGLLAEAIKEAGGEGGEGGEGAAQGGKGGEGGEGAAQGQPDGGLPAASDDPATEAVGAHGNAETRGGAAEVIRDVSRLTAYLSAPAAGDKLYVLPLTQGKSWRSFTWLAIGLLTDSQAPVWLDMGVGVSEGAGTSDPVGATDDAGAGTSDGAGASEGACKSESADALLSALRPYLENPAITKIMIDAKQAYLYFSASGIEPAGPCEDLHLMGYLLDPADPWRMLTGLEETEPGRMARDDKESQKSGRTRWSGEKIADILGAMARLTGELRAALETDGLLSLYREAEAPLAMILGEMERRGVRIAPEVLRELGDRLRVSIAAAQEDIYRLAGQQFNIHSPRQMGEVLYDRLGLPRGKKTKTGYSTDAETLEYLAGEHEIAGRILEYRQYTKLQSTYIEGLLAIMAPDTHRVHTSLNQTITVTGRLSSTEPNLQNIPIRMEEGRQIRRAFIPSPGCCLLSGDYSQIELRILAHVCGDEALRIAFRQGQDIHRSTAAEVFGLSPREVTPELRRAAKAVNFGLIYGISDFGLASDLGISREDAKAYMDRYFSRYPGVKTYFDRLLAEAEEKGYVETVFGRRRYLPELKSANYHTRAFGRRAAMNAPLQGAAADIMKLAMVAVQKLLRSEGLGGTMVLQVHDELLFDMPKDRAAQVGERIREAMENVVELAVPLQVDMKTGDDWYGMEDN